MIEGFGLAGLRRPHHMALVVRPLSEVPTRISATTTAVPQIAVARFVHCALAADLPPGWHTQPDHLHHTELNQDLDGPPPEPAPRLGCDPGS